MNEYSKDTLPQSTSTAPRKCLNGRAEQPEALGCFASVLERWVPLPERVLIDTIRYFPVSQPVACLLLPNYGGVQAVSKGTPNRTPKMPDFLDDGKKACIILRCASRYLQDVRNLDRGYMIVSG